MVELTEAFWHGEVSQQKTGIRFQPSISYASNKNDKAEIIFWTNTAQCIDNDRHERGHHQIPRLLITYRYSWKLHGPARYNSDASFRSWYQKQGSDTENHGLCHKDHSTKREELTSQTQGDHHIVSRSQSGKSPSCQ